MRRTARRVVALRIPRGNIYNQLGKLAWIAGTFWARGHVSIVPCSFNKDGFALGGDVEFRAVDNITAFLGRREFGGDRDFFHGQIIACSCIVQSIGRFLGKIHSWTCGCRGEITEV